MVKYEFRPATEEDIKELMPDRLPYTMRATALFRDAELVAVAGIIVMRGASYAFSEIKPGATAPARTVYKLGMEAMKFLTKNKGILICEPSPSFPNSEKFLKALGWKKTKSGDYYAWN